MANNTESMSNSLRHCVYRARVSMRSNRTVLDGFILITRDFPGNKSHENGRTQNKVMLPSCPQDQPIDPVTPYNHSTTLFSNYYFFHQGSSRLQLNHQSIMLWPSAHRDTLRYVDIYGYYINVAWASLTFHVTFSNRWKHIFQYWQSIRRIHWWLADS